MKIIILKSSPNKNGSSNMLADHFRQGAEEAGHTVEVIFSKSRLHVWPKP